jgi:SAM-dependent methyltransferase
MTDISQHDFEIHENLRYWNRKPLLREVYAAFHRKIANQLVGVPPGPIVECGSGVGNLKTVLPQCTTTDLFPNPWIDQVENVYALSFAPSSVAAVVLFDVFHHLEYPGTALAELHRTLVPGGRLIIFDPAMGLLGRAVLGLFHHEPLGLRRKIIWEAPESFSANQQHYYAAQGNAWRVFARGEYPLQPRDWKIMEIRFFPALLYLLAGGFRGPTLVPRVCIKVAQAIDRLLEMAPRHFASRMLVVLQKP